MSEDKTFWEGCHVVGGCNALHRENDRLGACEVALSDEIERKDAAIAEMVKEICFIIRDMEDGKILVTPCYDVHPAENLRAVIAKYNTKAAA